MSGRGSPPVSPSRALAVLAAALLATDAVRRLVAPPLRSLAGQLSDGHPWGSVPLPALVLGGCAAALAACWLWLVACAGVVTAGAVRGRPPSGRRRRGCPRLVRTVVLAALGVAVGTGPSYADLGPAGGASPTPGVVGLPLPDRVAAAPSTRAQAPAARTTRVRAGDSLWAIAARHLPPGSPDAVVSQAWRRLAATNAGRIGDDPDLIFPGTVLRLPPLGSTLDPVTRKESS